MYTHPKKETSTNNSKYPREILPHREVEGILSSEFRFQGMQNPFKLHINWGKTSDYPSTCQLQIYCKG
jgi:hypothetical protein